jgi:hypothetical protein
LFSEDCGFEGGGAVCSLTTTESFSTATESISCAIDKEEKANSRISGKCFIFYLLE